MIDVEVQPSVSCAIPRQVGLECTRELAKLESECKSESKPANRILLCLLPPGSCLDLPRWIVLKDKTSKSFSLQVAFHRYVLLEQQQQKKIKLAQPTNARKCSVHYVLWKKTKVLFAMINFLWNSRKCQRIFSDKEQGGVSCGSRAEKVKRESTQWEQRGLAGGGSTHSGNGGV